MENASDYEDQKIASSNPARVVFSFWPHIIICAHLYTYTIAQLHSVINPFAHAMKQFESFCCLSLYTHLSTLQINWLQNYTSSSWPCGVMDNASDYEDQKIASSNPARVVFSFWPHIIICAYLYTYTIAQLHSVINPFAHAMKQFESFCCLSLYTHLSTLQINWLQNYTSSSWPCGVMDNASDFGSEDCRFESCQGHFFPI